MSAVEQPTEHVGAMRRSGPDRRPHLHGPRHGLPPLRSSRPAPPRRPVPPEVVARRFAQAWLEVEAARRGIDQLEPLVDRELFAHLRDQPAPRPAGRRHPARLVALACHGDDDRREVVVRVGRDTGQSVLALELRNARGSGWRVTTLVVGPTPGRA